MRKSKKIVVLILISLILCLLSFLIYLLLKKFDITNIKTLREFVGKFGSCSWLVFIIIQLVLSVPIFVVPLEDELWVSLSIILFGAKKGFVLSMVGMALTSYILYLLGRVFGVKLANKIVGEKLMKETQSKTKFSSKFSLPFMYLIPFFPHDVLCMISGINKMNSIYFMVVTIIMRSLEIIAICFFGGDFINWKNVSPIEWVILLNLLVIDIMLLFKLKKILERRLEQKNKNCIDNEHESSMNKESN